MGMRTVIFFLSPHFNLQCSLSHLFSKQTHISSYRPNGVRFVAPAGTSEFLKRWDPIIGDIVSFKHHGFMFATQKPKSPMLFRIRLDLTWDQVLDHWKEQKPSISGLFFFLFLTPISVPILILPSSPSPLFHQPISTSYETAKEEIKTEGILERR